MKRTVFLAAVLCFFICDTAWAADDGQTQPRLSYATLNTPGTSVDIIPPTNGAGNVKGIHCKFVAQSNVVFHFYVNGGAAQTITVNYNRFEPDANGTRYSGWIPFNTRFDSSIRIQMERPASGLAADTSCTVSWALD